jgi:hypothetical protein
MSTINRLFRPVGRKGDSINRRYVVVSNPITSDRGVSAAEMQTNSK